MLFQGWLQGHGNPLSALNQWCTPFSGSGDTGASPDQPCNRCNCKLGKGQFLAVCHYRQWIFWLCSIYRVHTGGPLKMRPPGNESFWFPVCFLVGPQRCAYKHQLNNRGNVHASIVKVSLYKFLLSTFWAQKKSEICTTLVDVNSKDDGIVSMARVTMMDLI